MSSTVESPSRAPAVGRPRPHDGLASAALPSRAGHRPDIEGLRAVAVLLVMASHAGLTLFAGGYVGVDVFFVISGFLITQLLMREVLTTRFLDLRTFYARRARRLLPASMTVLVASVVLTWAFLPPNRWLGTAYEIMASAVYGINWLLAAQSVDYLREDAAPSIVQHFWSLAVEEQFYILWPCLILLVAWAVRRRRTLEPTRLMLAGLAVIGLGSLAWSVYYTVTDPARAYFVSTTRLWELALGAAIAILALRGRVLRPALSRLVGWVGMIAIAAAALLYSKATLFPGYAALVPTLGAAAVIVAGLSATGRGAGSAGGLLSLRPMQVVGRLSYSLYLCHWPAVVVATAVLGELTPEVGVAVVAASAVPAYLLHRFVENPIRFSRRWFRRTSAALNGAVLATVISLVAGLGLFAGSWPPPVLGSPLTTSGLAAAGGVGTTITDEMRADPKAVLGAGLLDEDPRGDTKGAARDTYPVIVPAAEAAPTDRVDCLQNRESAEVRSCASGRKGSAKVVALVGDSHAGQWAVGLDEIASVRGWELREYAKESCSFSDVLVATRPGEPYTNCPQWAAAVLDRLLAEKPSMVVVSHSFKGVWINGEARFRDPAANKVLSEGFKRYFKTLNDAGIPVVVIQDTPRPELNVPECVQTNPTALTRCAVPRAQVLPETHGAEFVASVDGLADTRMVDLNDAICPVDPCAPVIGNVLVYRDTNHLTGTYVRSLAPRLDKALGLEQVGPVATPGPTDPNAVLGAAVLRADALGDQNGAARDTYSRIVPDPAVAVRDYIDCVQSKDSAEVRTCSYGRPGAIKTVAVVGDSHANQWVPGVAEVAAARGWRVVEYTKAACSLADVMVVTKEGQPYTSCRDWATAVMQRLLTTDKPDMVITSELKKRVWLNDQVTYGDEGRAALVDGYRRHYQQLNDAGVPLVVLQDSPNPGINIAECVQTHPNALTECAVPRSEAINGEHGIEMLTAAQGLPNTRVVELNDAICPIDPCAPVIGNVLVYRDTSHLTGTYVRSLVPRLTERINLEQQ